MKVGEETYTAGDVGPWGTIMAVQRTPKHYLDTLTQSQVGRFAGANVRGGQDGKLNVAVVFGPKKEVSLTRVSMIDAFPTPCSH